MVERAQGGNAPIPGTKVPVTIDWAPTHIRGEEVDVSAFILDANGKVRSDRDFVFYGANASPCGTVQRHASANFTRSEVDLGRAAADVDKIAFTATLARGARFGDAQSLTRTLPGIARFAVRTTGMAESTIIVGELYHRNGAWKVRAVGPGATGGLGPLATHLGVDISDEPEAPPAPPPMPTPSAPPAAAPRLNLQKITLEKSGQSARISLDKGSREVVINLNWTQGRNAVDLGVFYELRSGQKFVIDGLQFSHGRGGPRHPPGMLHAGALGVAHGG